MCMGGQAATIKQPDYRAYDQQFELQRAAIDRQMNNKAERMQARLNKKVQKQQGLLVESNEAKRELAENTNAQAMRLSALIGPPPPEKSAEAPSLASSRGVRTKKGKAALRIERRLAATSRQGTGLNIT